MLCAALGDANATRTHELEHAVEFVQFFVERENVLGETSLLDDCIGGVDLDNAAVVEANHAADVAVVDKHRGAHFVKGCLVDEDFIVGVVVCLKHLDASF